MKISWQTKYFFLLKIFNVSMHKRVVRSFVFMVGFRKTILERVSYLWTSKPYHLECQVGELLNNLLAWYRPTCPSQFQILVKTGSEWMSHYQFCCLCCTAWKSKLYQSRQHDRGSSFVGFVSAPSITIYLKNAIVSAFILRTVRAVVLEWLS